MIKNLPRQMFENLDWFCDMILVKDKVVNEQSCVENFLRMTFKSFQVKSQSF